MKRIITFLLLTLVLPAFSQSVNLDKFYLNLSYVILPPKPVVDKTKRTYTVVLNAAKGLNYDDAEDDIDNIIKIDGFRPLATKGYLAIATYLQNPEIVSSEVKTIENKVKNSKGVETIERTYKVVVAYKGEGRVVVTCAEDPSLNDSEEFKESYTKTSPIFSEYKDANDYLYNFSRIMRNDYIGDFANKFGNKVNRNYGFRIYNTTDNLWILASKKHPEFDSNNNAFAETKGIFDFMKYNEPVAPMLTELQTTIKYFEEIDKKFTSVEKPDKKLRYGAYYNLATIYYYLDMPDESDIWCDKLIANDYDAGDGKYIKRRNDELRKSFAINQVNTRHMDVAVKVEKPKTEKINFDAAYSLKNDPQFSAVTLVLSTNETITGYTKNTDIDNLDQKIAISIPDDKGVHNYSFRTYFADQVSKMTVNERDFFTVIPFKLGTQSGAEVSAKFVREVLNGKTVSIYQYYTGEVIVKKNSAPQGYSTNSVGWQMNPRGKFIELADSCPKLAARANNKEFQNNINSLRTFVEALDMCN
ncbi:hypothetical protein [Flavobacterium aquidurense]|uniref:hypothetical protein n=1 Tax=Flavobacterium aquidurense TaxID=362413 RepID=UPI00285B301A|nr:hypothetical protein [Flavobacterium aquidurense]MDR7372689.1 hypothetical protein [Flavobacterium aquidurense]